MMDAEWGQSPASFCDIPHSAFRIHNSIDDEQSTIDSNPAARIETFAAANPADEAATIAIDGT
jgi:hypothetical protein